MPVELPIKIVVTGVNEASAASNSVLNDFKKLKQESINLGSAFSALDVKTKYGTTSFSKATDITKLLGQETLNLSTRYGNLSFAYDKLNPQISKTSSFGKELAEVWNLNKVAITGLVGALGATAVMSKTISLLKTAHDSAQNYRMAVAGLTGALGFYSNALVEQADALEKTKFIHSEEIIQADQRLALYIKDENQIRKLIPAVIGLAKAKGLDLTTAANLVAVAFSKGENAANKDEAQLGRLGITFKKTGDDMKDVDNIIGELNKKFEKSAGAMVGALDGWSKFNFYTEEAWKKMGLFLFGTAADKKAFQDIENSRREAARLQNLLTKAQDDYTESLKKANTPLNRYLQSIDFIKDPKKIKEYIDGLQKQIAVEKKVYEEYDKQAVAERKAAEEARKQEEAERKRQHEAEEKEKDLQRERKRREEERRDLIKKVEHENALIGLSEYDKKLHELDMKYKEEFILLKGNLQAQNMLTQNYQAERTAIENDESEKRHKKFLEWRDKELQELEKRQDDEIARFRDELREKHRLEDDEKDFKKKLTTDSISLLKKLSAASKEDALLHKTIAMGEAGISAGKGILGVLENTDKFIKWFGPVAGPVVMGAEIALIAGIAAEQIYKISSAKMAAGGVVTGGISGQDSVPAMLMPGEIVYNPANPNPNLARMITNTTSNTNTIYGPRIYIQGNPDRNTISAIGEVTEKALINAMRRAQMMGKINAPGLTIRN